VLILLPLCALVVVFLSILGRSEDDGLGASWRRAFLLSAAVWGGLVTLISESLSLFQAIDRLWLAVMWLVVVLVAGLAGLRQGSIASGLRLLRRKTYSFDRADRLLLSGMAVIGLLLLMIGWVSPPNNVDALLYHMSRVVHWAEHYSLRHYPTAYNHQLLKPIWAETAILNLRVLWGNDRPASLVQWFSMLGSLIGVSAIAGLLGASRKGQILAAAAAISVPMGILQASGTQNDYVTAFWVTCLAYLVVLSRKRPLIRFETVGLGLALGIGVLTKGPFFVYAPPLMVWFFLSELRRGSFRRVLFEGIVLAGLTVLLNAGFWSRNIVTYGGPYGTSDWLRQNLGIKISQAETIPLPSSFRTTDHTRVEAGGAPGLANDAGGVEASSVRGLAALSPALAAYANPNRATSDTLQGFIPAPPREATRWFSPVSQLSDGAAWWIRKMTQTIAWNLVTPSSAVNSLLVRGMQALPPVFGLGPDFQAELSQAAWNHEDTAGNPVHLFLVPWALAGLIVYGRRMESALPIYYTLVSLATYTLVPVVIGHGNSIWGLRYQLPFFILLAPTIAMAFSLPRIRWIAPAVAGAFLVSSLPWVFLNNTRPIIGLAPWPTRIDSVFTAAPEDILLAVDSSSRHTYAEGAEAVKASGCMDVGLRLNSSDLEYAFWWLLDAPQSGVYLETIYTFSYLERYRDLTFKPCAIICTICGDRVRLNGLHLTANYGKVSVFVGPNYVPDEDG